MEMLGHIAEWGIPTAVVVLVVYIYQLQLWRREERARQRAERERRESDAREAIRSGDIDRIRNTNKRLQEHRNNNADD